MDTTKRIQDLYFLEILKKLIKAVSHDIRHEAQIILYFFDFFCMYRASYIKQIDDFLEKDFTKDDIIQFLNNFQTKLKDDGLQSKANEASLLLHDIINSMTQVTAPIALPGEVDFERLCLARFIYSQSPLFMALADRVCVVNLDPSCLKQNLMVRGNRFYLSLVFRNLVLNSIAAYKKNSEIKDKVITISIKKEFVTYKSIRRFIFAHSLTEGHVIKTTVSDNAGGITQEDLYQIAFILKAESTTRFRSDGVQKELDFHGFGFSIIKSMLGTIGPFAIDIKTTIGEGTDIHIYLPVHKMEVKQLE